VTDPEAFRELTRVLADCRPRFLSYIVRGFPRLADEAEDILQDVWLEARRRVADEGFQPQSTWESWLRAVIRRRAIDRLRVLERQVFLSWQSRTSDVSGQSPSPEPRSPPTVNRAASAEQSPAYRTLVEQQRAICY